MESGSKRGGEARRGERKQNNNEKQKMASVAWLAATY